MNVNEASKTELVIHIWNISYSLMEKQSSFSKEDDVLKFCNGSAKQTSTNATKYTDEIFFLHEEKCQNL